MAEGVRGGEGKAVSGKGEAQKTEVSGQRSARKTKAGNVVEVAAVG